MMFWVFAIAVLLIACAALYYAGWKAPVNEGVSAETEHFQRRLAEIETDEQHNRLSSEEAVAAKAELARQVMANQKDAQKNAESIGLPKWLAPAGGISVALIALVVYLDVGSPALPSQPLNARPEVARQAEIKAAITRVEEQLSANPDDLRGWQVIAPVYMQSARYDDAVRAYEHILSLSEPDAVTETDLAEAIILANGGATTEQAMQLLRDAAQRDPSDVRSRFYLAGEATRSGNYEEAIRRWNELLDLSDGHESWLPNVQTGLATAMALQQDPDSDVPVPQTAQQPAEQVAPADTDQDDMIADMVDGLSTRLESQGGSLEDWLRLMRSRLVMGQSELAQKAYDEARAAYPDPNERAELDAFAANNGLKTE